MKLLLEKKIKRKLFIALAVCIIFIFTLIAFISPITRYLIEKYDEKFTGRQITMDWAYVNPFTGYIHFENVKIYEYKNDTVFISLKGISANITVNKLLAQTYEISELKLTQPKGVIINNNQHFNFNDLIEKFRPQQPVDTMKGPLHFNILNINIEDGEFSYVERMTPVNYTLRKVNILSTGFRWDSDTTNVRFSFMADTGSGYVSVNTSFNLKSKDYQFAAIVKKFDLKLIAQYLKDLSNFGTFSAILDADVKATGNFLDKEDIDASGMIMVSDLHLGKSKTEDYAAFEKLKVNIIRMSPKNYKRLFDSILLVHPYFKYERYDYLDNLQVMFGKNGSNIAAVDANPAKFNLVIEIAKYLRALSRNFLKSNYKINHLAVLNGELRFKDFSISEEFSVGISPFNIKADSIDKTRPRAVATFNTGIVPYGKAGVKISINPKDSSDFDIYYNVMKVPVSVFNPYMVTLTSFPLDRGTIELNGSAHVRNGDIVCNTHLLIIDPRASLRIHNKDMKWRPVPLLFSFIRERGNVIDYEIPISGSLDNPKFNMHDVLFDLLRNIFIKPITTPYRMTVKSIESEIEKSMSIKWAMRESSLRPSQKRFIIGMAEFLAAHPEANILVHPQLYDVKEKECILFFEAKKKIFPFVLS